MFMLSCHLCLLISCYSLVFWILSFDCSFCLIAWYLYFLPFYELQRPAMKFIDIKFDYCDAWIKLTLDHNTIYVFFIRNILVLSE